MSSRCLPCLVIRLLVRPAARHKLARFAFSRSLAFYHTHLGITIDSRWRGGITFPHIPPAAEKLVARRIFRVPNVGMNLSVFVGDEVRLALTEQGIQGFEFVEARVESE